MSEASELAGKNKEKGGKASSQPAKVSDRKSKKPIKNFLITGLAIILAAAVFCGIWFIPAAISAEKTVRLSREEALAAAEECFIKLVGEEAAKDYYVDYISRSLRHDGSIFKGVYIYNVEYQNQYGTEYKIEVSANTDKTVIRDID